MSDGAVLGKKTAAEMAGANVREEGTSRGGGTVSSRKKPVEICNERESRLYDKDGRTVKVTSWLSLPSNEVLISDEIGRRCEELNSNRDAGFKMPKPGGGELPVWSDGFTCKFCEKKFNHLTQDTLQFMPPEHRKQEYVYALHLRNHCDDLQSRWFDEFGEEAPDTHVDTGYAGLIEENKELKAEMSELKDMMGQLLANQEKTKRGPGRPKKVKDESQTDS